MFKPKVNNLQGFGKVIDEEEELWVFSLCFHHCWKISGFVVIRGNDVEGVLKLGVRGVEPFDGSASSDGVVRVVELRVIKFSERGEDVVTHCSIFFTSASGEK